MKRAIIISVAIILIVLIGLAAVINYPSLSKNSDSKPFYVGVTFGGNNVQDAKTLIDKVANYTNLFVLQSGLLKDDASAVNEIGDYAVSKGLHFAAYFDVIGNAQNAEWIGTAKQRWGGMFVGVYLGDEPGGKMLDGSIFFYENQGIFINKLNDGVVNCSDYNGVLDSIFSRRQN